MSAPWNPAVSLTVQRALTLTGCAGVAEMAAELIEARTQRDAIEVQRYAAIKEIDRLTKERAAARQQTLDELDQAITMRAEMIGDQLSAAGLHRTIAALRAKETP